MAHHRDLVARIRGALRAGLGPKLLSAWSGIPVETIKEWSVEECRANVAPDDSVLDDLREALLGKFLGRKSTR